MAAAHESIELTSRMDSAFIVNIVDVTITEGIDLNIRWSESKRGDRLKWFSYIFSSLCHLFFDLRVVGASDPCHVEAFWESD